jgi:hypothetical protein
MPPPAKDWENIAPLPATQAAPTNRPRYHVVSHLTSMNDEHCELTVRSNGKVFYIHISPSNFRNSAATTAQYLVYLEVLRSGEEEINGVLDTDMYEWAIQPFEPLMVELAPPTTPAVISGKKKVTTLHDYLFPEWFVFRLEAIDDKLVPQRVYTKTSGHIGPGVWLDEESRKHLATWTSSFEPSQLETSFKRPEDALLKAPEKVLVHGDKTAYFFKAFNPGAIKQAKVELETYKRIATAKIKFDVNICHLHGVVQDKRGLLIGMLLTYINHQHRTLQIAVQPDTSPLLRQRWVSQVKEAVTELHRVGIIWGDAKPENILVDMQDNAWIADFGGGYTEGWVKRESAGTKEGDLQGLAKILSFINTR